MKGANGNALTNQASDDGLAERIWNGQSDYWDALLFEQLSKDLLNAVEKGLKTGRKGKTPTAQTTYNATDGAMITAMETNVFHFSAAKTLAEVQQLNQALRESEGYADFRKKASRITDTFNRRWQQTEYGTAINCAENASAYHRLKSEARVFPYWEYRTAGDDRVREEHTALDGLTLRHDDPLWDQIYPPNGWKCRCYVVPRMAHEVEVSERSQHEKAGRYMATTDWKNAVAQHWNINRAKQQIVFEANQMYIRKFAGNAAAYMDKVKPDKWGLENSIGKLQKQAKETSKMFNGTPDEFWNANRQNIDGREYLVVKDYNGREWRMDRKSFDEHTSDRKKKRAFRTKSLANLFDVVKNPDEVWLGRDQGNSQKTDMSLSNYNLIKYYKDTALAVSLKIEKNKMKLKTWFVLKDSGKRRGLLIKRQ